MWYIDKRKNRKIFYCNADALAPSVSRSSAAMVLIVHDNRVISFHEEGFQVPMLYQC